MGATTTPARHSRAARSGWLIERDWELASLEQVLDGARAGAGATILIEGPAGAGKSSLIAAAADMASKRGIRVLGAAANRLERGFAFGIANQLLEPLWSACTREQRESLLVGPAGISLDVMDASTVLEPADPERRYPVIHGLFWMINRLVLSGEPASSLALVIDDAHWADEDSLRFLAYLTERIADLPLALILAARPGEEYGDAKLLASLRRGGNTTSITPAPLSGAGVATVLRRSFPEAEPAFCDECARLTHGNPFLVSELADSVRESEWAPTGDTATRLAGLVPPGIRDSVAARLDQLPSVTRLVVTAVSVLGDAATIHQVADFADTNPEMALRAADALARMDILIAGLPLRFAHPIIATAVSDALSPLERAQAHRRAAIILQRSHARPDQIADHLLLAPGDDDPSAIELLRDAARRAEQVGNLTRSALLLERALQERADAETRAALLIALTAVQLSAGLVVDVERLAEARRQSADAPRRAALTLLQGRALLSAGDHRGAATVLQAAGGQGDGSLRRDLRAARVSAAALVPELRQHAHTLGDQLVTESRGLASGPSVIERAAIAHLTLLRALEAQPRQAIRRLADLAWGDGALLAAAAAEQRAWPLLITALVIADELERAAEIGHRALACAAEGSSPARALQVALGWALHGQGRIDEAHAMATAALQPAAGPVKIDPSFEMAALALIASCLIERGELEAAEAILAACAVHRDQRLMGSLVSITRAHLRLAQDRPAEALHDATQAGLTAQAGLTSASPGVVPWRSAAAFAQLALGERERARGLAEEELQDARRAGVTRAIIRNLRLLGLAAGAGGGVDLLTTAVDTGATGPSRLEQARALVDLGAALRRANRRVDARQPLRAGLDLAHRAGAVVLAQSARTELVAAGARPRRASLAGVESLTVSQLRVAELAARGLTTRQVAERLFVSPKTVEFHLRQTYLKLEITSREQLTRALAGSSAGDPAA